MAGRPLQKKLATVIEEHGGDEWFFDKIVEGQNVNKIALDLGFGLRMVYFWLNATEERKAAWQEAKRLAAHTHADMAMDVANGSSNETAKADWLKIKMHQWIAEHYNREEYGQQPLVNVQTTINQIHLNALQATPEELAEVRARLMRVPREQQRLAAAEEAEIVHG